MPKHFLYLIVLFATFSANAQSILEKRITAEYSNQSLISIFKDISQRGGFNFSYNSALFTQEGDVSGSFQDEKIIDILRSLISNKTLAYRERNNHVIIYKPKKTDVIGIPLHKLVAEEISKSKEPGLYDTVFTYVQVIDTLYEKIIDTNYILIFDTLLVRDTIFYDEYRNIKNKRSTRQKTTRKEFIEIAEKSKIVRDTVFIKDTKFKNQNHYIFFDQENTWQISAGLSTGALIQNHVTSFDGTAAAFVDTLNEITSGLFSSGVHFDAFYGSRIRFGLGLGVSLSQESINYDLDLVKNRLIGQTFDSTEIVTLQGRYFTFVDGDTLWIEVYDTAYNIIETNLYDTVASNFANQYNNSYIFISFPLYNKIQLYKKEGFSLSLTNVLMTNMIIRRTARIPLNENGVINLNDIQRQNYLRMQFNYMAMLNFAFKLRNDLNLELSPYFSAALSPIYDNRLGIQNKHHQFGLKVSIVRTFLK